MRTALRLTLAALAAVAAPVAAPALAQTPSAKLLAAVADPGRPAADRERDSARKPAQVLAFARVHPGETVVDFIPGGGYFTRIFARAVAPNGRVYAVVPQIMETAHPGGADKLRAAMAAYPDVTVRVASALVPPQGAGRVDLVWTAQNYHDLHNGPQGAAGAAPINAAIFKALKPGGLYVIEDHAAAAGSGARDTSTLPPHRPRPGAPGGGGRRLRVRWGHGRAGQPGGQPRHQGVRPRHPRPHRSVRAALPQAGGLSCGRARRMRAPLQVAKRSHLSRPGGFSGRRV